MNEDEREWCMVPGCDEQPYPGDDLCVTHQREEPFCACGRRLSECDGSRKACRATKEIRA